MASLQRLVLSTMGHNGHVVSPRHLRVFSIRRARLIHTAANDNNQTPPKPGLLPSQRPAPRHQVQERSENLSVPGFNPPGGGGGPGPGGSNVFQLTRSPLFDAALTTIIGIGMGELQI